MSISKLIEFDRLAQEEGKKYKKKRFIFKKVADIKGRHFVGIAGPRGSGKTVILKQLALETADSFYISLDTFREDLFETIKELTEKFKIRTFLLDEIHFNPHYEECLKKIYDFLDVGVVFSSSVSLSLLNSAYDLSRRVLIKKLYPFSFREYLYFTRNILLDPLSLDDIINKNWAKEHFSHFDSFDDYLKGGNLPFSLQEPFPIPLLKNIVSTVIRKDIPSMERIAVDEIETIEQLLEFVGKSEVDDINYSTLSSNIKITKYKAKQYVSLLEKAFILLRVLPEGTNVMKEPKILMALPYRLIYSKFKDSIGAIREDFFTESMLSSGKEILYLKSTRGSKTPDYIVKTNSTKIIIEVGGAGKGRQQFKGVKGEKQMIMTHSLETDGIKRPLFLAGMLTDNCFQ